MSLRPVHFNELMRLLQRRGSSRADAEDIIQEAMLRHYVYVRGKAVVNEVGFLRRTVLNLSISKFRAERGAKALTTSLDAAEEATPLQAATPTPEQTIERRQRIEAINTTLESVNPRTREIFMASRFGYAHEEIARELGVSLITVKRHIGSAHAALEGKGL